MCARIAKEKVSLEYVSSVDQLQLCSVVDGLQGMKRWGFSGQPASHGNSLTHRAMGSSGQSQGGGSRVLPGKKMAGRMGGNQHTTQNLRVLDVNAELGLVLVNGLSHSIRRLTCQYSDERHRSRSWAEGLHSPATGRHQEVTNSLSELEFYQSLVCDKKMYYTNDQPQMFLPFAFQ